MSGLVAPQVGLRHLGLFGSLGAQLSRPNTPVAPFPLASVTGLSFVDPSVTIRGGTGIVVGTKDYFAPWASLDARRGTILIGSGTTVQDNASLVATRSLIILGDNVLIGSGAVVRGNSQIGAPGGSSTSVGANAVINGAGRRGGGRGQGAGEGRARDHHPRRLCREPRRRRRHPGRGDRARARAPPI